MKRIISALLTFAMLLTLITVPMMVTAEAWSVPAANFVASNTSEVFNTDYRFYATKGTPDVDGTIDASWANAYTLRMDATRNVTAAGKIPASLMENIYIMWDEDNLYILDVYEYDNPVYSASLQKNWSTGGADCSLYYLVLPNEMTGTKLGAVCMPHVAPGDVSQITGETKAVPSNVFARERAYTTTTIDVASAANTVGSVWTYADAALKERYDAGITSYTAYTENGWLMETAISWDLLDYHNSADFVPATGVEIGFNANCNNGSGNGSYYTLPADHIGFSVLELVEENPTEVLIPDLTWINDPECVSDDGYIEISDAADLLGMSLLSLGHGSYTNFSTLGLTVGAGKAFSGKKFRIMNDIDLNPDWDANGTALPEVAWPGINYFADAEIDGNNKTISGLYNVVGVNYSDYKDGHGFISRMGKGVYIHDLSFANGKFVGDGNDNVGTVAGLVHTNGLAGESTLSNIHSSMIIEGAVGKNGGIIGGNWTSVDRHTILIENCVFTGSANFAICGQGKNGSTYITQKNCYSTVAANNATIEGSNAAAIQATSVVEGKFDVRILGLIDEAELDLDAVGMKIVVTYTDGSTEPATVTTYQPLVTSGTKVFKTVNANGTPIEVSSISAEAEYAYGAVLTNVPAGATDTVQITVVLTRTIDGVAVESTCAYSATYLAGAKQ